MDGIDLCIGGDAVAEVKDKALEGEHTLEDSAGGVGGDGGWEGHEHGVEVTL